MEKLVCLQVGELESDRDSDRKECQSVGRKKGSRCTVTKSSVGGRKGVGGLRQTVT